MTRTSSPAVPRMIGSERREPGVDELEAAATHARQRASLYRRKVLMGEGEPGRLAELERVSAGAAGRLREARGRGATTP